MSDHATNMPATVWFAKGSQIRDSIKYKYDSCGNISEITQNGHLVARYTYDSLNRLIREDNKPLDKTVVFTYDGAGNITERCKYAYTEYSVVPHEEESSNHFSYDYVGDKLVSYNREECTYNNIGNPTKYRNNVCEWQYGNRLTKYGGTTFEYDSLGRRVKKGGTTFTYDSDGRLIKQSNGFEFFYDASGVAGFKYSGAIYFYRKDAQGNIIAILNKDGIAIIKYYYDAWGNSKTLYLLAVDKAESYRDTPAPIYNDDAKLWEEIAVRNPFRYRGYYYDTETGLYYLQTRYYDPEVGRFISQDSIEYADPETVNGLNLYAYCGNNPVMYVDPNGTAKWWHWLAGVLAVVGTVFFAAAVTALTLGVGTTILAGTLAGAVIHGAAVGTLIGAGIGITAGGIIGGAVSGWTAEGILVGMGIGFGTGAIIGAVIGGAVGGAQFGTFASEAKLTTHYANHGTKMGFSNAKEYAKSAKYVIKNGTKVSYNYKGTITTGYIKFFGQGGGANYAFVGMNGSHVATFGIRSVTELIRLGISLFVI